MRLYALEIACGGAGHKSQEMTLASAPGTPMAAPVSSKQLDPGSGQTSGAFSMGASQSCPVARPMGEETEAKEVKGLA